MKNIWKIIFILLIIGLIIYLFKDFFNNEENNNNDDDNITNKTNNVVIDDDYNTNYSKNNTIDLDSLLVTGNIKLNNNIITLKNGGDYYISGTNNAQIIIDSSDKNIVHLVLDNVNLTYNYSPIYIKNAEKVIITVIGENTISDTSNYNDDKIDATIYSKDDLVINGDGILNINGNYKNGVVSNDGLKIINTTLNIVSNNNGIKGKDYVYLEDSNINITSNGDGIKSNNDSDSSLGFVTIKGGTYNIDSQTDGIQAETILYIEDGNFNIKTGNGSQNASYTNNNWGVWGNNDDNESAKGLKAGTTIIIDNGEFLLDTSDDSIHSNDEILIKNGTFNLSSGDDGIHADDDLTIENGNITINKSYEGIEASIININNGNINIISSDDGINAAGGDGSSMNNRPGRNNFSQSTGTLKINGGDITINASGDGLDSNGNIYVNGGNITVYGPTDNGNGAIDYDGIFEINAGSLIAAGSSGMAQMPGTDSTINSIMINFNQTLNNSDLLVIKDSNNNEIISFKGNKNYNNIVISNENLTFGNYKIYVNNKEYDEFTISSKNTKIGNSMQTGMMQKQDMVRPR